MGCLYLRIEVKLRLVGGVDQGLMKNRQIDRLDGMLTKRNSQHKNILVIFSP